MFFFSFFLSFNFLIFFLETFFITLHPHSINEWYQQSAHKPWMATSVFNDQVPHMSHPIYICMYVYICIHIHTYIHIHTFALHVVIYNLNFDVIDICKDVKYLKYLHMPFSTKKYFFQIFPLCVIESKFMICMNDWSF